MSLFLISFFILYGSLHYYIFSRVREAFSPGLLTLGLLAFFLLLMVSAPIVVYTAASRDWDLLARIYGHIGFVWMGIAFLFFAGAMAVNLYRLIAAAAGWFVPGVLPSPGLFWRFVLPLAFALIAAVYGYFDALNIRTERITVKSPKIPAARSPVRIAQISDVHLGVIVRGDRLKRILGAVRQAAPDLFVSTGDLLDAQVERLDELTGFLSEIRPRLGKYAITGNHEYYAGLGKSLEFTRRAGFTLLRGESLVLDGWLNLAGVDDAAGAYQGLVAGKPEGELLSGLRRENFTLFLKHRPNVDPGSPGLFDLQISGHTHRGQIFPFVVLTRLFFTYYGGLFRLPEGALLYVSRGSGTWGPPIRFLSPPEVTVYELVHGEGM